MEGGKEYLYKDLTQQIIGYAFDIFRQLGPRYPERIYQKAFEVKFQDNQIKFSRECHCKVELDGKKIASFRLDFLVEDKVVVELKVRDYPLSTDIAQVLTYMKTNDLKVGLILRFSQEKVVVKRLVL